MDRVNKKDKTLTITCDEKIVTIENYNGLIEFTRDGDTHLMVFTNETIFINLKSGETHTIRSLSYWRGYIQLSPNGKLAIIDAGIIASGARQILVVDLTDWDKVTIIYRGEIWANIEYETKFDQDHFVISYNLEFWALDDKVARVDSDDDVFCQYLWNAVCPNMQMGEYYCGSIEDLTRAGGEITYISVTITRARNAALISPDTPGKWSQDKEFKRVLESSVFLDEMELISMVKKVRPRRKNIVVNEDNFEQYL